MNKIKINGLLIVLFAALSFSAYSQDKLICKVPSPFVKLDPVAAKKVQLIDVLGATEHSINSALKQEFKKAQRETSSDDELSKGQQKVELVNFWAAWCAPCRQELPYLDSLSKKNLAEVSIINVGDEQKEAQNILNNLAIKHVTQYYADGETLSTFNILGLPASIVYSNKQVFLGVGKLSDETAISQWLQCLNQKD